MTGRRDSNKALELAVQLDFFLGILGLFGVGEAYLGEWLRGAGFLAISGVLYACLAGVVMAPSIAWVIEYLPTMWGLGYCVLLYDIFRVTDRLDEGRR